MSVITLDMLKTAVLDYLCREEQEDDKDLPIESIIRMAEVQFNKRLRTVHQETIFHITTIPGRTTYALPPNYLQMRELTLMSNPPRVVEYLNPQKLDNEYSISCIGEPVYYSIKGTNLVIPPVDGNYDLRLDYYSKIPPLSDPVFHATSSTIVWPGDDYSAGEILFIAGGHTAPPGGLQSVAQISVTKVGLPYVKTSNAFSFPQGDGLAVHDSHNFQSTGGLAVQDANIVREWPPRPLRGPILEAHLSNVGNYKVLPANPVPVLSNFGTRALFNMTWEEDEIAENFLLDLAPDLYIVAAICEAAYFLGGDEQHQLYGACEVRKEQLFETLNLDERKYRHGSTRLVMRAAGATP